MGEGTVFWFKPITPEAEMLPVVIFPVTEKNEYAALCEWQWA